ncbi:limbin-like isoform X3 [Dunckerocampus dactyliophorus]|uniref:limbin-like isoform X3 n=1 Tax=Dunckerocampus dactyliophorus TaxID=161453 RepID=UPI002404D709|nr:limbin-like isoform X3 [Dunckerocampus dactyliophorus]
MAVKVTICCIILVKLQVLCFFPTTPSSSLCPNGFRGETPGVVWEFITGPQRPCNGICQYTCWWSTPCTTILSINKTNLSFHETKHSGGNPAGHQLHRHYAMEFCDKYSSERPLSSSAPSGPWTHSVYTSFSHITTILHLRERRSSLTRYNPGHTLPQLQGLTSLSTFGVKFHKCAQVLADADPPQLTFFLLIHNLSPVGGTNLSQVAIRDSIFGIVPLRTEGRVVERGYQMFAVDSLSAGSQIIVNYTAQIRSHKSEVLDLPAFLTFSNLSQNDVSMYGPLTANLTLRVNSTDRIHPNHGVHFAGFVSGFFVTLVLLFLGFLAMNVLGPRTRLSLLQQKKNRGDPDPEYADCNMNETAKDEATFEDKIVDIMVLEDPQNMNQALENLEMSTLLHATNNLEATRIQIHKDVLSILLGRLRTHGQVSAQAQQRLLSVLHGQLLGMEGRLKEERGVRMAALAGQCNLETREEMEAEHHRVAAEKAQAELLCHHADQQELLRYNVLLEKLHKLSQAHLQRILLVRHEEASAKVQRQIIEWRRVELHKIFSEELEEATKMGELETGIAKILQHSYFECQDQLEDILDVVVANWRYMLAERHAQRKFLLHSLHSLNSLISDTFSSTSCNLDNLFAHVRRGSTVSAEQLNQLQEKAQKDLVMVRQRLDEALGQEKRAMRCGLIKKRRELISDMLRVHIQRQKDLSGLSKNQDGSIEVAQQLHCWQDLLTSHSLEFAELINNLDEEAAADIRKVTMRVIQISMAEVKAIQPSTTQTLLTLLPLGMQRSLLQVEPEAGQGGSTLLQGQERLHQEGKAALHTLSSTRDSLQKALERELQEQRELRTHYRAFFRCLCSSQLTLSDDEQIRIKLEFQKCLSVMDRCLMLSHAVSRTKVHTSLSTWRKDSERQMINPHFTGKAIESSQKTQDTADLFHVHKKLKEQIQLFEKEREMENIVKDKVMEEMRKEREDYLRSQADSVAMQMTAIHCQKAERRTKVLETSRALLTLHSLLIHHLRETKSLERQEMAQSIQKHCTGLEEAEEHLQDEIGKLGRLDSDRRSNRTHTEDADADDAEEDDKEKNLFGLQQTSRMSYILQEALHKCDEVIARLALRLQEMTTSNQAMEDLREQIQLRRLHSNCDQDLMFAVELVKQSRISVEVLLELLRLLVPTMPESELLCITDALCPKQHCGSSSTEQEPSGSTLLLPVKLREDLVHRSMINMPSCCVESMRSHRLQEKRQSLMERLLPSSCPPLPTDVAVKGKMDSFTKAKQRQFKSAMTENAQQQQHSEAARQRNTEVGNETLHSSAEEEDVMPTSANVDVICQATGERLFVFRDPPQSHVSITSPRRKKKRNFLNLKKSLVAPTSEA